MFLFIFFFKQKTAYEMRISDWSSDVCSSDLSAAARCDLERLCHGADGRMAAALVLQAPQEEDGMKRIRLTPLFFRRIPKWVGLILGLQFLLRALSGSVMALLDKDKVGGHGGEMSHAPPLPAGEFFAVAALPRARPLPGD